MNKTLAAIVFALAAAISGCDSEQPAKETPKTETTAYQNDDISDQREPGYSCAYGSYDIKRFREAGVDAVIVNTYVKTDLKNYTSYIIDLAEERITGEKAAPYFSRFNDSQEIKCLIKEGISADVASSYHDSFDAWSIIKFCENSISPEIANKYALINVKYNAGLNSVEVKSLIDRNVPLEEIEKQARERWIERMLDR